MAFTYEIDTERNIYPNLTVYKTIYNGQHTGWRVNSNDGYVFYDTTEDNTEWNEELQEEVPVIYYYREIIFPIRFNWDNFSLVAVPESEVDENYIFGVGDNHEKA